LHIEIGRVGGVGIGRGDGDGISTWWEGDKGAEAAKTPVKRGENGKEKESRVVNETQRYFASY